MQQKKAETSAIVVTESSKDVNIYKDGRQVATIFYRPQIPKEVPSGSVWYNRLVIR